MEWLRSFDGVGGSGAGREGGAPGSSRGARSPPWAAGRGSGSTSPGRRHPSCTRRPPVAAAQVDTRIKGVVTSAMYDISSYRQVGEARTERCFDNGPCAQISGQPEMNLRGMDVREAELPCQLNRRLSGFEGLQLSMSFQTWATAEVPVPSVGTVSWWAAVPGSRPSSQRTAAPALGGSFVPDREVLVRHEQGSDQPGSALCGKKPVHQRLAAKQFHESDVRRPTRARDPWPFPDRSTDRSPDEAPTRMSSPARSSGPSSRAGRAMAAGLRPNAARDLDRVRDRASAPYFSCAASWHRSHRATATPKFDH
jgi:hypothetical protein